MEERHALLFKQVITAIGPQMRRSDHDCARLHMQALRCWVLLGIQHELEVLEVGCQKQPRENDVLIVLADFGSI